MTSEALLAYLPDREPRRYLYDMLPLYPERSGKGLRPALCVATCRAFGGTVDDILGCAVALELLHNAFLVHDDVEDGSEVRRGLPTLHAEYGVPLAINTGDALVVTALGRLMDSRAELGADLTWRVLIEVEHMVRQSVEGQAFELGWVADNVCDLTEDDYFRMCVRKTCWYTSIHPCRIGALVGSRGTAELDRLHQFAFFLGAAFQIQDDLLNLGADPADLREGQLRRHP